MSQPNEEPKATVMIVDDDPVFRALLRPALEGSGYGVIEVADGETALVRCGAAAPSLAVIDAVMPGLDGFVLCRELRAQPATTHLPILMVTGLEDEVSMTKAYESGATDFVTKPVDGQILVRRVRYLLRGARTVEALRRDLERLEADAQREPENSAGA